MEQARPARRTGTALMAVLGVLVLLVAGAVGWLVLRGDDGSPARATGVVDEATVPRAAGQMTADLTPTGGFVASLRVVDQSRQQITVRSLSSTGVGNGYAGEVSAYDPGTFDPTALKEGERTVVAGQDAWYVDQYVFPGDGAGQRTAVLGWQDPSGAWLLTYADTAANEGRIFDLDHLQRLSEQVVISPAHDLRAPFRLGWMPAGLSMTFVAASENAGSASSATVGLSAAGRKPSTAASYAGVPKNLDLSISATAPDKRWSQEKAQLSGATTIAGRPAWLDGNDLVVQERQCVLRVHTSGKRPRAELERLVKEVRVGDCAEPDSWTAPAG